MNRHERRVAKALARGQSVDLVVAVHEAGHCVARVLSAGSLGWDANEVIVGIDVYPAPVGMGVSSDGKRGLQSQATSWGRFLSKPMHEFLLAMPDTLEASRRGVQLDLQPIFAKMRSAGIDVDSWCTAKSIEAIFGPMAEARVTEKPFDEVWDDYSSEADRRDMVRFCRLSGMTDEQFERAYAQNICIAEQHMDRPEVWRAILALANKLKPGRTSARVVAGIITRALAGPAEGANGLGWVGAAPSL